MFLYACNHMLSVHWVYRIVALLILTCCVCVNVDFAKQEWIPWGLSDEKSVMSKNVWEHLAVFVLILFEYAWICLFSQEKIQNFRKF